MTEAARGAYVHTVALMGTVVTFHVVGHDASEDEREERVDAMSRAVAWFERVTDVCSRFDPASEVRRISRTVGSPQPVSDLLFECARFALSVAEESDGAFDPTVGTTMEAMGFDREFRSGLATTSGIVDGGATFRDVTVDASTRTITLHRPVLLDLGAVAKGMAVDLAARELAPLRDFAIDAGGDLYFGGRNANGSPWSVGIRDPRSTGVLATMTVSDAAVCTSGDYERTSTIAGHHLIDPRTGASVSEAASVTVTAPSAMVADALSTAAFVLGPERGIAFLEGQGVEGLIVTPSREQFATRRWRPRMTA